MWRINDWIVSNFLDKGDIIQWEDRVISIIKIEDSEDGVMINGIEMEWEEDVEMTLPDAEIIPIVIWE
jgi:hypothetical protein